MMTARHIICFYCRKCVLLHSLVTHCQNNFQGTIARGRTLHHAPYHPTGCFDASFLYLVEVTPDVPEMVVDGGGA